jgi:membrane protease YdiL (CAAX protease family)
MVRAMPQMQEDPTLPVLSWILVLALAWMGVACLIRFWRTTHNTKADLPPIPQGGVSTEPYRLWDIAVVLLLFLMFAGQLLMIPDEEKSPAPITPENILTTIVILGILACFATTVVSLRISPIDWLGLHWKSWRSVFWIAPLSLLVMWSIFGGLMWAGYMDWMEMLGVDTVQESVRTLRDSDDPAILGWMTFAALVAAPICEEVIFRGYCYPVLKKYGGAMASLVTTSLIFACAHGNLPSALPLFLLGMLLVYTYERTGSLWAPVAVHFLFNTATVAMQFVSRWYDIPFEGS